MFSLTNYNNIEAVTIKFLKHCSSIDSTESICEELGKHPNSKSLLAITDVLNTFNIENTAYRIKSAELENRACPFIVHTNLNKGDFLLVDKIGDAHLFVSSEKWNKHKISKDEFDKIFLGVVLTADIPVKPKFELSFQTLAKAKPILITLGALLLFIGALKYDTEYFALFNLQLIYLTILKTAGLVTSILLLIQSIDTNNPLIQRLCQGGSKLNCNAILSSKSAKVFEGLSWSEVGFFYFAGSILLLLFTKDTPAKFELLAAINVLSLPYTIYSIYYQARIAKQWCVFCCTVQAILWLEFASLFNDLKFSSDSLTNGFWQNTIICFLLPVLIWLVLRPLLSKLQLLKPLRQQLQQIKYNPSAFTNLLAGLPRYAQPDLDWSIGLGNVEAGNIITVVSNPYCQPCAVTHKMLNELINANDNVQARIIFNANNNETDMRTNISQHLMRLNESADKSSLETALHDWYERKYSNYEAWAKIHPATLTDVQHAQIEKQKSWCRMADVTATPTLFLNGTRLPDFYQLSDLKYMLE